MSMVNVGRATRTLGSTAFLKSAALIVGGALLAQVVTNYARSNVYDVQFKGGDAAYAAAGAAGTLTLVPGRYSRPLALGMTATGLRTVLSDYNVL